MAHSTLNADDRIAQAQQTQVPVGAWLAIGVLIVALLAVLAAAVPPALDKSALEATYRNDRRAVNAKNLELLASILSKLAKLTGNKEAHTGIAAFGVMSAAFSFMAQTQNLVQQRVRFCDNSTVVAAFGVSPIISQNHTAACQAYDVWIPLVVSYSEGNADAASYMAVFAALLLALVKLDNAIAQDP